MIVQEEQILIENRNFMFLFSIDYLNNKFLIDIYDRNTETTIASDHEITNNTALKIYNNIDKPSGTVFKKKNMKFLVRNHDKVIEHENNEGHFSCDKNSIGSIYDTRNESNSLNKLPLYVKEAWLKI